MSPKEALFQRFYRESKNQVYRLCLGYTGNKADADDLFQEVLVQVWNSLDSFRGESKMTTWVYRIATNTAMMYLKKRNRQNHRHATLDNRVQQTVAGDDPEVAREKEDRVQSLYQAIATLKEIDRIIISLLFEGCSYRDIAQVTGLSTTNVGVRINRIKKSLSNKLSSSWTKN